MGTIPSNDLLGHRFQVERIVETVLKQREYVESCEADADDHPPHDPDNYTFLSSRTVPTIVLGL